MLVVCLKCKEPKPTEAYGTSNGHKRNTCIRCRSRSDHSTFRANSSRVKQYSARSLASAKIRRVMDVPRAILQDCRASDKKKNLSGNDLTRQYIVSAIAVGCTYCGDTSIRMTLDRLDNDRAHTQDNVVPACIRCNYIRGSMPHAAWALLVPSVKEARELGLFGEWRSKPIKVK